MNDDTTTPARPDQFGDAVERLLRSRSPAAAQGVAFTALVEVDEDTALSQGDIRCKAFLARVLAGEAGVVTLAQIHDGAAAALSGAGAQGNRDSLGC